MTGLRLVYDPPDPEEKHVEGLQIVLDGEARSLALEELAELDALEIMGDSGKGRRDAWSLRTLAAHLGGAQARVTRLRGEEGRTADVSVEAWNDAARTPVLRLNRRGKFKFHWTDADANPLEAEQLRNVTTLEITRGE